MTDPMTDAPELLPDEIWLLENIEHDEDDDRRIIWSPDSDCERIHEGYKIIGHYTRAARPRPDLEAYKSGTWFHAKTVDDMQAFYRTRLPAIREAAGECGYAIAVHGSERRDFDLIAFPWVENPKSRFDLVKSIQFAACGFTQNSYDWALRAHGRLATAFPICWCEWHDMVSAGHIDLSVIDVDFLSTAPRPCVDLIEGLDRAIDHVDAIETELRVHGTHKKFTMRVPADMDNDSDFLFGKVLDAARLWLRHQQAHLSRGVPRIDFTSEQIDEMCEWIDDSGSLKSMSGPMMVTLNKVIDLARDAAIDLPTDGGS